MSGDGKCKLSRRRVVVSGRVQGVGFRRSAWSRAAELGLTGWVRNLPDRGVELCFQGETGAVDEMEDWCRVGSQWSNVRGITVSEEVPLDDEKRFEVR
ncbi:MAG: acylphosphatase [Synergistaceae bacterium]|jgi:acylphosphatase|nr:acylphosphatase [Synergistaceae bacterium]